MFDGTLSPHSAFWRKLAYAGARYGPRLWVELSPPIFGLAFALALPAQRRAVRQNLRLLLGARAWWPERLDVARTFASYASCLAESLAAERPEALTARHRLIGEEHFRAAMSGPRGAVLLTAHVGPWDAAGHALAKVSAGRPVVIVMLKESDPGAVGLHDEVRARAGVRVVHVGDHPLDALPILRHLRQGGICAIQVDRVPQGAACVDVDLAGSPFRVPKGPFLLAAMAEVPILPLFACRVGYFDYEMSAFEPLRLPRRCTPEELQRAAQTTADTLARFLEHNPTQWFNFEPASPDTPSRGRMAPERP